MDLMRVRQKHWPQYDWVMMYILPKIKCYCLQEVDAQKFLKATILSNVLDEWYVGKYGDILVERHMTEFFMSFTLSAILTLFPF